MRTPSDAPPHADAPPKWGERTHRLLAIAVLVLIFLTGYWVAIGITVWRGPGALIHTALPLDRQLPYWPGAWPLYWLAYPFVVIGGGIALWRLPDHRFRRAAIATAGMTLVGVLVQIALPARAPWPEHSAPAQQLLHRVILIMPYNTLPSMHVAYSAVAAGFLWEVYPRSAVRWLGFIVTLLVAMATLVLREHVILDAVTGLSLGAATVWWWGWEPERTG